MYMYMHCIPIRVHPISSLMKKCVLQGYPVLPGGSYTHRNTASIRKPSDI